MHSEPLLVPALWTAWFAYWMIAARRTKPDLRQESFRSRLSHILPMVLGACLVAAPRVHGDFLAGRLWPPSEIGFWLGACLVALGLGFSVWARQHLAEYWSGIVTLKQDHRLIRSGPYGWVRHPIYSGLLLAMVGSAIVQDRWFAVLGLAIVTVAALRKMMLEERWLGAAFPADYSRYRREVAALIPWLI